MDTTSQHKTPMQPKNLIQLLPCIKNLLSKDSVILLTKKQECYSTSKNHNYTAITEKKIKPLTIAELRALTGQPSNSIPLPPTSTKKRPWNSSVKVDKMKSLTADGKLKYSSVRKALNFQAKPRPMSVHSNRVTKIPSPAKKSIHAQAKTKAISRISGINKIPKTPVLNKTSAVRIPDLKITNESNSDVSFLQKEKEINDFEEKSNALTEEPTLENIAEVSPPVSTPFKEYRNVRDYFSQTCDGDNSILYKNNTIMSFDESSKRDERVLNLLCDMLHKTKVTNSDIKNREYYNTFQEIENKSKEMLLIIDSEIELLLSAKERYLEILNRAKKLQQLQVHMETNNIGTLTACKNNAVGECAVREEKNSRENTPLSRDTVIITKSPTYKVPKKNTSLRKRVFHKSMPNVSYSMQTPIKNTDKALDMYLQIKQQMTFLNTPLRKHYRTETPDTPAVTSHNLQRQLDKLYNED